jgi:peptide/nickel transport system permease protein
LKALYWYILRRGIESLATIIGVLILNFALIHSAPGDPAVIMAGEYATPSILAATRHLWGLDQPLYIQLLVYLSSVLRGNLGFSLRYNQPVLSIIMSRVPNTLALILPALLLGPIIGVILGALSAKRVGSKLDTALQVVSVTFYSIPTFFLGLVLLEFFTVQFHVFPTLGEGLVGSIQSILWHIALPVITLLTAWTIPIFVRLGRASMLDTLGEDYITTSKAIGYPDSTIYYRHALRNALLPSVTMMGILVGTIFMGSVLVETVFTWPGLGLLLFEAITARDYPLIMGIFTVVAVFVSIAMLVTDLVYAYLDPRVSYR